MYIVDNVANNCNDWDFPDVNGKSQICNKFYTKL